MLWMKDKIYIYTWELSVKSWKAGKTFLHCFKMEVVFFREHETETGATESRLK